MIDALIGQTVGHYNITERVGHGGMSAVFKAQSTKDKKIVALKVLHAYHASDPNFLHRFTREARAMAQLDHPNIVRVYDFNTTGQTPYIAMEHIGGGTLKEKFKVARRKGQIISLSESIRVVLQISDALAYAHSRDMVHRDIKPANILFDGDNDAILTDFGIVKTLNGSTQHTATGAMIGTPAYMSPEQGLGRPGDARSDIYALGVLFYQMVTGRLPFDADKPLAVVLKHINEPIPNPSDYNASLPPDITAVIMKALAKDPQDRFQTSLGIARRLREIIQNSDAAWARQIPIPAQTKRSKPPSILIEAVEVQQVPTAVGQVKSAETLPPPRPSPKRSRGAGGFLRIVAPVMMLALTVLMIGLASVLMNPDSTMGASARSTLGKFFPDGLSTYVDDGTPATPVPCDYNIRLLETTTQGSFAEIPIAGPFQMQWVLRNDGNCPILKGSTFAYEAGEPFGFLDKLTFDRNVDPGERIVMAATLYAPVVPGTFKSLWRIADPKNVTLGVGVTFEVTVFANDTNALPTETVAPLTTAAEPVLAEEVKTGDVDFNHFIQSCNMNAEIWWCDMQITPSSPADTSFNIQVFSARPDEYDSVSQAVHTASESGCDPWVYEITVVGEQSGEVRSKNVFLDPSVSPISDLLGGNCQTQ
ncbi:MAG: protein kinase domain-containing protein [Candidatus Promineifilaceae bacterium]